MLYLGMDVHSKWMAIRGFDAETGDLVEIMRQANDEESLAEVFGNLPGPLYGVMESGTNSWAVYRLLEPYFEKLIVVDPATVWGRDVRRGAKTDRRDAMKLAMDNNIDVISLDEFGDPFGRVWHSKLGSTTLIRKGG